MSFSILNNIPSIAAENQLNQTNSALQKTLFQLSSGSRINTGADDAAGLAIANGIQANVSALTQSAQNASQGSGELQVADGALAQVTTLLNRAVTLATEASNGTVNTTQAGALDAEFTQIKAEIDQIGSKTNYNGVAIFSGSGGVTLTPKESANSVTTATALTSGETVTIADTTSGGTYTFTAGATSKVSDLINAINSQAAGLGVTASLDAATGKLQVQSNAVSGGAQDTYTVTEAGGAVLGAFSAYAAGNQTSPGTTSVFLSDGSTGNGTSITTNIATLSSSGLSLSTHDLTNQANAQAALTAITAAVQTIATDRGNIGASVNRLQAAANVINSQVQNLTQAQDSITAADIPTAVANLTKYNILTQTGISALAQANQLQQSVLKLLQ